MRVLITGITGFAGRHLADHLRGQGHDVFGTARTVSPEESPRVLSARDSTADHLLVADIADRFRLTEVVRQVRPDALFHLAAVTSVAASFNDPDAAYQANLLGSLNVFSAVRTSGVQCRIVWIGSSDVYGQVGADDLPVTEQCLLRPVSPYAASKAAADLAAYQWSRAHGLDVIRMRPFNHTGPGQPSHFVCSDFARQMMAVKSGRQPAQIEVGNLDVVRDFSDVRDVVRAYVMACEHGAPGEAYNVCSGIGRTPRAILEQLIHLSGVEVTVAVRGERQRPADVPALIGSAAKLRNATGWAPVVSWDQTLRDLLEDWRQRLNEG